MALRIRDRWEMDLSPGTDNEPPKEEGRLIPREGLDGGAVLKVWLRLFGWVVFQTAENFLLSLDALAADEHLTHALGKGRDLR